VEPDGRVVSYGELAAAEVAYILRDSVARAFVALGRPRAPDLTRSPGVRGQATPGTALPGSCAEAVNRDGRSAV
jgi:hypothetical protein